MGDENENIDRERVIGDYKHSILQSVEHDEAWGKQAYSPDYDKYQQEWNAERSKQLDENEAVLKQQYDEKHCEEVTGLDSNGYRHQVISERVDRQMAEEAARKGDEDLEAGRKTPEGVKAGMPRYDARMRDGEQFRWDSARPENAKADFERTTAEARSFRQDYWAAGGSENGAGVTEKGADGVEKGGEAKAPEPAPAPEKQNETENSL